MPSTLSISSGDDSSDSRVNDADNQQVADNDIAEEDGGDSYEEPLREWAEGEIDGVDGDGTVQKSTVESEEADIEVEVEDETEEEVMDDDGASGDDVEVARNEAKAVVTDGLVSDIGHQSSSSKKRLSALAQYPVSAPLRRILEYFCRAVDVSDDSMVTSTANVDAKLWHASRKRADRLFAQSLALMNGEVTLEKLHDIETEDEKGAEKAKSGTKRVTRVSSRKKAKKEAACDLDEKTSDRPFGPPPLVRLMCAPSFGIPALGELLEVSYDDENASALTLCMAEALHDVIESCATVLCLVYPEQCTGCAAMCRSAMDMGCAHVMLARDDSVLKDGLLALFERHRCEAAESELDDSCGSRTSEDEADSDVWGEEAALVTSIDAVVLKEGGKEKGDNGRARYVVDAQVLRVVVEGVVGILQELCNSLKASDDPQCTTWTPVLQLVLDTPLTMFPWGGYVTFKGRFGISFQLPCPTCE